MKKKNFFRNLWVCLIFCLATLTLISCRLTEIPDDCPASPRFHKKMDKQAKSDTTKHPQKNVIIFND